MAINITNTTGGEQFNFLANQSSILRSTDTNKITINGVNVIVSKPKVGDIMCVTRYTDESGGLLPADDQKVIWIDGLSINPKQLSQEIEPVGICVSITGNKAMVRYRKIEKKRWVASERWELPYASIMNDNVQHSLIIKVGNGSNSSQFGNPFTYTARTRLEFVNKLNNWFRENGLYSDYSAELAHPDIDFGASDTSDTKIGTNTFKNRIIINIKFQENNPSFRNISIQNIGKPTRAIGKHIKIQDTYTFYKNNGFKTNSYGGCCRSRYYDYVNANQVSPTGPLTSINSAPSDSASWPKSQLAVKKADFEDTSNSNCKILRDNFATYDEYFDSMMVKYPCGLGGVIEKIPSGNENTYKLAHCYFRDIDGNSKDLYPAAKHVANISVHGPNLGAGNWWLPSPAELVQMMHDLMYCSWQSPSNINSADIINSVIYKLQVVYGDNWSYMYSNSNIWTPCISTEDLRNVYAYGGDYGFLGTFNSPFMDYYAIPITIYEF